MNRIDRALRPGSLFRIALFALSLIILVYYIVSGGNGRGGAFVILLIGLAGTFREYRMFRRRRDADPLEDRMVERV